MAAERAMSEQLWVSGHYRPVVEVRRRRPDGLEGMFFCPWDHCRRYVKAPLPALLLLTDLEVCGKCGYPIILTWEDPLLQTFATENRAKFSRSHPSVPQR